jgi:predicted HTH domain antitoxin
MTLTLPDDPVFQKMTPDELRLDLACALYARGRISAVKGSHLAKVDLVTFQGALADRQIPRNYTVKDLHDDLAALERLPGP